MNTYTEADGRDLAIQMLYELNNPGVADLCGIQAEFRKAGHQQLNVSMGYLQALIDRNDPRLIAGFASVITDFVGIALAGAVGDISRYEELSESDFGPGNME